jgi:hypothetical protein
MTSMQEEPRIPVGSRLTRSLRFLATRPRAAYAALIGSNLRKWLHSAIGRPIWKDKISASVLFGSEAFVRQMIKLFKGNRHEQARLRQSERLSLDWQTICAAVSRVWKGDWDQLAKNRGNDALPAAWYLARNFAGMRLAELGDIAGGVAYPAVSMAIRRFEKRLSVDRDLQRKVKAVQAVLKI